MIIIRVVDMIHWQTTHIVPYALYHSPQLWHSVHNTRTSTHPLFEQLFVYFHTPCIGFSSWSHVTLKLSLLTICWRRLKLQLCFCIFTGRSIISSSFFTPHPFLLLCHKNICHMRNLVKWFTAAMLEQELRWECQSEVAATRASWVELPWNWHDE